MKAKKKKINFKKFIPAYIMLLPGLAYFVINNYIPMYGITIAFRKLDFKKGILRSPFCGFDNFKFLFASGTMGPIIRNTVLYNVVFLILGAIVPVVFAILFNEMRAKRVKKLYQTAVLLPHLMSMVIVSSLVYNFLSADLGFINKGIIEPLTGQTISFYQEKKYWPFILTFIHEWKGLGFSMVLYLSTLLSISDDFYEAAKIDGATRMQQIRYIMLPFLRPTIIMMLILGISKIFNSDFGLFYQVPKNSGVLYPVTETIDVYVYNALMNQNNIMMSSAASVAQAVIGFTLVLVSNLIIKKISPDDSIF